MDNIIPFRGKGHGGDVPSTERLVQLLEDAIQEVKDKGIVHGVILLDETKPEISMLIRYHTNMSSFRFIGMLQMGVMDFHQSITHIEGCEYGPDA